MARRSGLGKGLGALIPSDHHDGEVRGAELRELSIDAIRPNRFQPRAHFDEEALGELAASIAEVGVLQPILVRPAADREGEFELVAGERRWRSARRAGLETVPAIVQLDATDLHSLEVALIENLHRADLNPLEEAAAYQQLIEDFDLTHEQVAEAVSRSRVTVTHTLRLLNLPPAVQDDATTLEAAAARVEAEGLSVRATEELVRRLVAAPVPVEEPSADGAEAAVRETVLPDAGITELEHLLERHLDTRVRVDLKGRRGRVIVEFADLDDLERIYRAVTGAPSP
jgi:ParB family chromosome partitioning protein